jgi:sugar phosphate isomerase/epimerase
MNNPVWVMTSAFPKLTFDQVVENVHAVGAQGAELCVFRRDGSRRDHVATHLDYETFNPDDAQRVLDICAKEDIRISVGAYDNLLAGDPAECEANQNHILKLIRIAHLLGGDANDVCVGTFVGYNHELGKEDGGFAKNLDLYAKVFTPIVAYAESLGVTLNYENCPMEGWRPASAPTTYNNLPCTLAARKLMYALIPSPAHGETYDPSHDAWQNIDPVDVLKNTDFSRLHRVHIKGTRNHTGSLAAIQLPDAAGRRGARPESRGLPAVVRVGPPPLRPQAAGIRRFGQHRLVRVFQDADGQRLRPPVRDRERGRQLVAHRERRRDTARLHLHGDVHGAGHLGARRGQGLVVRLGEAADAQACGRPGHSRRHDERPCLTAGGTRRLG